MACRNTFPTGPTGANFEEAEAEEAEEAEAEAEESEEADEINTNIIGKEETEEPKEEQAVGGAEFAGEQGGNLYACICSYMPVCLYM